MALSILLYVSEFSTVKFKDWTRIHAAEINFVRCMKGYTKMGIFSLNQKKMLEENREKWNTHLQRIDGTRIPEQFIRYKLYGRRDPRRQRKRLRES
jgi:hypothetical protein